MKRECEIVQDLLFSYNDGVLSKSSIELVENHLKDCKVCQDKLKEIQLDNNKNNDEKKEVDYLKNVRKKLDKKTQEEFFNVADNLIKSFKSIENNSKNK